MLMTSRRIYVPIIWIIHILFHEQAVYERMQNGKAFLLGVGKMAKCLYLQGQKLSPYLSNTRGEEMSRIGFWTVTWQSPLTDMPII